jgi:hypothetical protein
MSKRTLLGLSAILFVLAGTLAYSTYAGSYGCNSNNQGGTLQRAEGPLPPIPWPWELSMPSVPRVS